MGSGSSLKKEGRQVFGFFSILKTIICPDPAGCKAVGIEISQVMHQHIWGMRGLIACPQGVDQDQLTPWAQHAHHIVKRLFERALPVRTSVDSGIAKTPPGEDQVCCLVCQRQHVVKPKGKLEVGEL